MKNKFIYIIYLCFFVSLPINSNLEAKEIFNFNVSEIEITQNGNIFKGYNGGEAFSDDGISIKAETFEYNKISKTLISSGNVQLNDENKNIIIKAKKILYFKNLEKVIAEGNVQLIDENRNNNLRDYINYINENPHDTSGLVLAKYGINKLFKNQENINLVKDAMYGATNEVGGTSFASRLKDKKFIFAGKTGSSQVKRFTEAQREAEVKQEQLDYKSRDHALFVAFAPVSDPTYAISVVVEHGGSGSSAAAPIAKKVIKRVLERHQARENINILTTPEA